MRDKTNKYDVLIIGAGIGGIICTKYALDGGLRVLTLEKSKSTGGIWRDLPSWQDIQSRKEDWAVRGLSVKSEYQKDVLENVRRWIPKFKLENYIRCSSPVTRIAPIPSGGWTVSVGDEVFHSQYVILATGAHNKPNVPRIVRDGSSKIKEFHASNFRDPSLVHGKRVTVVGGGASAFDLVDLALENGASEIDWVYRNVKWMVPTKGPKYERTNIRDLGYYQMLGVPLSTLNKGMNSYLRQKYKYFGMEEILPEYPYDYSKHQLVPGRRGLVANFTKILRHKGEILSIEGRSVTLSNGENVETDIILYGTGYQMDLSFTQLPLLKDMTSSDQLAERAGAKLISIDYPNLFLLASSLDTVGSTPIMYAYCARTIVSHMLGRCEIPQKPIEGKLNYWDLTILFAQFDKWHYPRSFWRPWHLAHAWIRRQFPNQAYRLPRVHI